MPYANKMREIIRSVCLSICCLLLAGNSFGQSLSDWFSASNQGNEPDGRSYKFRLEIALQSHESDCDSSSLINARAGILEDSGVLNDSSLPFFAMGIAKRSIDGAVNGITEPMWPVWRGVFGLDAWIGELREFPIQFKIHSLDNGHTVNVSDDDEGDMRSGIISLDKPVSHLGGKMVKRSLHLVYYDALDGEYRSLRGEGVFHRIQEVDSAKLPQKLAAILRIHLSRRAKHGDSSCVIQNNYLLTRFSLNAPRICFGEGRSACTFQRLLAVGGNYDSVTVLRNYHDDSSGVEVRTKYAKQQDGAQPILAGW